MKTKLLTIIAVGIVILSSCTKYPPDSERLLQDLAVYTQVDVNANFNTYQTFSISPTVAYIDGKDSSTLTTPNAMALLNRISADMISRGFKQVTTPKPDLGISVTAIKGTNTTVYSPGWYWGYPGYYPPSGWGYPGYGYGYPYYPTYVTSYSTGTVIIDLVDFKLAANNKAMVRWNAYIRGLLTNSHTQNEVITCVDQAFAQTPSLKTNANN